MRPMLHCLHGWGFDASFFAPLAAELPEWEFRREDLGFFGGRSDAEAGQGGTSVPSGSPVASRADGLEQVDVKEHGYGLVASRGDGLASAERPLVLVGHSMGLALLLERDDLVARASAVVALCGFPRFCRAPGFKSGLPPRLVKSMLDRFAEAPAEVLRDFRVRCGLGEADAPEREAGQGALASLDAPRLAQALERLLEIDVRDRLARLDKPLFVLAAEDDLIAPPALSLDAFAEFGPAMTAVAPRVLGGGHVLPLTRPGWCADRLREFLARTIQGCGKGEAAGSSAS